LTIYTCSRTDLQVDDTGNTFAWFVGLSYQSVTSTHIPGYTSEPEIGDSWLQGFFTLMTLQIFVPPIRSSDKMVRAVDQFTFQPKINSRLVTVSLQTDSQLALTTGNRALNARSNVYYRIFQVKNLM
jgi:hypothetical protein